MVVPMVPQSDGMGAIPKLLHAQLAGLRERADISLVGTFGELPGQAEAAAGLEADPALDAHFADRRRPATAGRRWRVRAELAAAWVGGGLPWRTVSLRGGMQPVLDRASDGREFDLIAVEDDLMSLRLPAGTPVVLTEHEASREAPAQRSPRPSALVRRLDWRRLDRLQARGWADADLIQVYAEGDAVAIAARAPQVAARVRVDPFGIELPEQPDAGLEREDLLLFTGTFTHAPNRDAARWLATEILPAVRARRPGAALRIVGSAPPSQLLADLDRPGVEVVADVADIGPHLAQASAVLAPVRVGGGMRLKVLEAMAAGKAVVTTELGAEGFDHFGPDLPLALGEGAAAIAEQAARLLEDGAARRDLGARARAFAERHHSPQAWASRLIAVYEEAIAIGRSERP